MLDKAMALKGYKLHGLDGELGLVRESYFDDQRWTLSYLSADTGEPLADRQVLISPNAITAINKEARYFDIDLTTKQLEGSPSLSGEEPISPQSKGSNSVGKAWHHRLRSTSDMSGYDIQAVGCEIGRVEDFVIDDETWAIRYLLIDTRNWWPSKKALISPKWIERVAWDKSRVFVNLSYDAIEQSSEFADFSLLEGSP